MEIEDWGEGAKVIAGGPWENPDAENNAKRGGVKTSCEICGTELVVFPASIEQAKLPDWHIIGRLCCLPLLMQATEVNYGGRVRENKIQHVTPTPIVHEEGTKQ
jgi:hypothetical protein